MSHHDSNMSKSLIVMLLDESLSMKSKCNETINGFNKFIEVQRNVENDLARIILIKFSTRPRIVFNCIGFDEKLLLTKENYNPNGRTALMDSIAYGINLAEKTQAESENVMFVILTDGEENCSKEKSEDVMKMIESRDKKNGWNFFYIGVKPEEWSRNSGMDVVDCVQFDARNPENSMNTLSNKVLGFRGADHSQR